MVIEWLSALNRAEFDIAADWNITVSVDHRRNQAHILPMSVLIISELKKNAGKILDAARRKPQYIFHNGHLFMLALTDPAVGANPPAGYFADAYPLAPERQALENASLQVPQTPEQRAPANSKFGKPPTPVLRQRTTSSSTGPKNTATKRNSPS